MDIKIKIDVKKVQRYIDGVAKQVPYAAKITLNNLAFQVVEEEKVEMNKSLDRPTPFTQRAYEVKQASKARLVAVVQARQKQAEYLKYQVFGGTQRAKKSALGLPVLDGNPLNEYGNFRTKLGALMRQKTTFSANIKGTAGIWRRGRGKKNAGKIKLLAAYEKSATYRPRLPFFEVAHRIINQRFQSEFRRSLAHALSKPK